MTPAKRQRRNASDSPPRKGVARLPKWIEKLCQSGMVWPREYEALRIAWAALEHCKKAHECPYKEGEKSMRAIRRLGR